MARTRGASTAIIVGEAELLDKEGKPIPTIAHQTWSGVSGQPNPDAVAVAEPEPIPEPAPEVWRCNDATVQRNMDARDLFILLGMILGQSLELEMAGDDYRRLHPDLKQHFRRVS